MDEAHNVEYEAKWRYIIHTEESQSKSIQWYFTLCAAAFAFLYTQEGDCAGVQATTLVSARWFVIGVLALFSVLTCLRLLVQKRNYDIYVARVRILDGQVHGVPRSGIRRRAISTFKLQYYSVCLVGGLVLAALFQETGASIGWSIAAAAVYVAAASALSFTRLIGD